MARAGQKSETGYTRNVEQVTGNVRDILIKLAKWKWPLIESRPKRISAKRLES